MNTRYSQEEVAGVASSLLSMIVPNATGATIIGLSGDLGAGKTTLTQAIASTLGVTEAVQSPTFVIAKFYRLTNKAWDTLVHVDAYRIEQIDELKPLGWSELLSEPRTLVVVEWPERIESALPRDAYRFSINHEGELRRITKH